MRIRDLDVPPAVVIWGALVMVYGLVWIGYFVWLVTA